MNPIRLAVIADMLEEGWPSMDLVADMLVEQLRGRHPAAIEVELLRPPMRRRFSKNDASGRAYTADRMTNRLWDYPRRIRGQSRRFDVFHVVDHSYSQVVHVLPADRTLVTCHDLDTFASVLTPESDRRSVPFRMMTRWILAGLTRAAHVACDTAATRDGLVTLAGVHPSRTSVVHNGPHPSCTPTPEPAADVEAARVLGRAAGTELLHVGSTIPRKRLDTVLSVFARIRTVRPDARLIRVGGPLTAEQRRSSRELGIADAVVSLPFLDRSTLAAVYRRASVLLLPSEREGFGLPVLEALACGTPVVASDIPAIREVGGPAAEYCPVGDADAWTSTVLRVLDERRDAQRWNERRSRGLQQASRFSWARYADAMIPLYERLRA